MSRGVCGLASIVNAPLMGILRADGPTMRTTTVSASSIPIWRASADHRFYVSSAIVALVVAMVAFAPGLLDASSRRGPLTPLAALHSATFTGWLILYLTQTLLASRGNLRLHRRLGVAGAVLAPVMMVVGYQTTIEMVRRGFDLSGDLERLGPIMLNTSFQILGMPIFGGLVLAALLYRRRPDIHKRLMWLTIPAALIGAPVAHIRRSLRPAIGVLPSRKSAVSCRQSDLRPPGARPIPSCLTLGWHRLRGPRQHPGSRRATSRWEAFVLWLAS